MHRWFSAPVRGRGHCSAGRGLAGRPVEVPGPLKGSQAGRGRAERGEGGGRGRSRANITPALCLAGSGKPTASGSLSLHKLLGEPKGSQVGASLRSTPYTGNWALERRQPPLRQKSRFNLVVAEIILVGTRLVYKQYTAAPHQRLGNKKRDSDNM